VFASKAIKPGGADGLITGNFGQVIVQIEAVLITYVLAGVGTYVILKVLNMTIGLRMNPESEYQGVDISEPGEEAYGEELAAGFSMTRVE
jgi:Amt family ammonium transporter